MKRLFTGMKTVLLELEKAALIEPRAAPLFLPAEARVAYVGPEALMFDELETRPGSACWGDCEDGHHPFCNGDVLAPGNFAALQEGRCMQVRMDAEIGFCPDKMVVLRGTPGLLDNRYLLYFLRQARMRNFIAVHLQGHPRQLPHTREFLRQLKIPLPTLFQQQNWCRQLDLAFAMRRKWALEARSRDTTRRLFFHNFFGSTGTMQQRWHALELHQLLDHLIIGSAGLERFCAAKGELLVRPGNLGCNRILLHDTMHVQLPSSGERRHSVLAGDVLLCLQAGNLGGTATAPPDMAPACAGKGVAILRSTRLEPGFLAGWLSSGTGLGEMERVLKTLTGMDLSAAAVRAMRLHLPPRAMQQEFVLADRALEADCDAAYVRLEQARSRFSQLEHEAFRAWRE